MKPVRSSLRDGKNRIPAIPTKLSTKRSVLGLGNSGDGGNLLPPVLGTLYHT